MTRSRRLAAMALGGAVALSCAVPTGPAQAAPSVDTPVATMQLSVTQPTEITYLAAGASGFQYRLPGSGSSASHWADYPGFTPRLTRVRTTWPPAPTSSAPGPAAPSCSGTAPPA
ncbi:hypothetical protein [Streptomyces avermitilis]|uniref:hypothetical protein n=1 Tax=Streptomyces avermitilis TaxID=33903 RepID=UPI003827B6E6